MYQNVLIFILSFVAMEGVAWVTHRYLMHGLLWSLHRDHHQPEQGQVLQRNDFFFIVFATPGIVLLYLGAAKGWSTWHAWAGAGISLYGVAYFLVHEVFIHRRFRFMPRDTHPYLVALRRAHAMHHKNLEKDGGQCFGMLLVPWRFYREAWTKAKQRS